MAGAQHGESARDGAHGSALPRIVAVETQHRLVDEAPHHLDLLFGQRSAHRGDHILDPVGGEGNRVHIAFDRDQASGLATGDGGALDIVKRTPLVEERGVGRVQIFRHAVAAFEDAPAKGDHPLACILDRQHHPPAKAIVGRLVLNADEQARLDQHGLVEPGESGFERPLVVRRPAKAELANGLFVQPAPLEIVARSQPIGRPEIGDEPLLRGGHHVMQARAFYRPFCRLRVGGRDVHPGGGGQFLHSIHELHAALVGHPADRIAMRAAAEAMVEALGIVDGKAGRLLIMEGAAPFPLAPGPLQLGRAHDERGQRGPAPQFVQPLG